MLGSTFNGFCLLKSLWCDDMPPVKRIPIRDLDDILGAMGQSIKKLFNQRLFITGGTGILGKWLLAFLVHADKELGLSLDVTVLTRNAQKFKSNFELASQVNLIEGDVRTFKLPTTDAYDYLIHAALDVVDVKSQAEIVEVCVLGTANVLKQAQKHGVKRLLFLSSGAVYGEIPEDMDEIPESYSGAINFRSPESAYGQGKRIAELLCSLASAANNFEVPVARCFAMVGPYVPTDKHFAITNFIGSALRSDPIVIEGDGTPVRTYLYMSDVVLRLMTLLIHGRSEAYNVGGGAPISIKNLAYKVRDIVNPSCEVEVLGRDLHGAHAKRYIPSVDRIELQWRLPKPIALDMAIQKTADWYRTYE